MHQSTASSETRPRDLAVYRERLTPSLKILAGAAIVAPMVALVAVPIDQTVSLSIGLAVAVLLIAVMVAVAPVVEVSGRELRAGRAHIDVAYLGEAVGHLGDEGRRARGVGLDPRGWYLIRGGIEGVVVVENTDPDDPVTSWTISTRTPDRVIAALRRAQRAAAEQDAR